MSTLEFGQVVLIVVVFVLYGEINVCLFLGVSLIATNLIAKFAKVSCLEGKPLHGGELVSRERHGSLMTRCIAHIANSWVLVLRLKGFCFYGSVREVISHVRNIIQEQVRQETPEYRRLKSERRGPRMEYLDDVMHLNNYVIMVATN